MKKLTRTSILNILGGGLLLVGIVLLVVAAQIRQSNAQVQAQPQLTPENSVQKTVDDPAVIQGKPVAISISSVGIQNSVIDGVFDARSHQWTLTLDKVQHAVMTYQPNNQRGLTFMYGHNRPGVFARLPAIKPGAVAEVKTDNNHTFYYRFKESRTTTPEDVSVFTYDGPPVLVLQTCTGMFFQNRQLFTFELIGVDHV